MNNEIYKHHSPHSKYVRWGIYEMDFEREYYRLHNTLHISHSILEDILREFTKEKVDNEQ